MWDTTCMMNVGTRKLRASGERRKRERERERECKSAHVCVVDFCQSIYCSRLVGVHTSLPKITEWRIKQINNTRGVVSSGLYSHSQWPVVVGYTVECNITTITHKSISSVHSRQNCFIAGSALHLIKGNILQRHTGSQSQSSFLLPNTGYTIQLHHSNKTRMRTTYHIDRKWTAHSIVLATTVAPVFLVISQASHTHSTAVFNTCCVP